MADKVIRNKNDIKFLSVVHSSYPREIQRKPGYEICERFSEEMDMKWLGAIGFAGTGMLDGRPLEQGWFVKWIRRSLDEVCKSIKKDKEISERARKLAAKFPPLPPLPIRVIKGILNWKTKRLLKNNNVNLYARPLEKDREER